MRDEWSSFADLLADLITKYAAEIDIDSLPDPDVAASPPQKETIMDFPQIPLHWRLKTS